MNNKKGGAGAIFILVLILMLASAIGGAYGYRVLDGKMAVRDAKKAVEDVDISDYDTAEQTIIQGYIDDATKDLEAAKTRKDVYEILGDFISDVGKVKTAKEKELEEALKAAEEAKKASQYSNQNANSDSNDVNTENSTDSDSGSGGYKSNNLSGGDDGSEDKNNGFLGSLLGGMSSGSSGN